VRGRRTGSGVAQRQSKRLLTARLRVRISPPELVAAMDDVSLICVGEFPGERSASESTAASPAALLGSRSAPSRGLARAPERTGGSVTGDEPPAALSPGRWGCFGSGLYRCVLLSLRGGLDARVAQPLALEGSGDPSCVTAFAEVADVHADPSVLGRGVSELAQPPSGERPKHPPAVVLLHEVVGKQVAQQRIEALDRVVAHARQPLFRPGSPSLSGSSTVTEPTEASRVVVVGPRARPEAPSGAGCWGNGIVGPFARGR